MPTATQTTVKLLKLLKCPSLPSWSFLLEENTSLGKRENLKTEILISHASCLRVL